MTTTKKERYIAVLMHLSGMIGFLLGIFYGINDSCFDSIMVNFSKKILSF